MNAYDDVTITVVGETTFCGNTAEEGGEQPWEQKRHPPVAGPPATSSQMGTVAQGDRIWSVSLSSGLVNGVIAAFAGYTIVSPVLGTIVVPADCETFG